MSIVPTVVIPVDPSTVIRIVDEEPLIVQGDGMRGPTVYVVCDDVVTVVSFEDDIEGVEMHGIQMR